MHPQCSSGGAGASPSRRERDPQEVYEDAERGLLFLLFEEHPANLTVEEARTERVRDPQDFDEADAFEVALRELTARGLVVREGRLLLPTRPAREMVRLGCILG